MNHIDQEAELYALGMLDDAERTRIDEHLSGCDACAALVGLAEAAVAALVDSTQQRQVRTLRGRTWWPAGIAAAFALATAGLAGQNLALHGALSNDGAVFATMVNSHFNHTQFQSGTGVELGAKAIYERHGKWVEILADGSPAWHVVYVRPDGTRERVQTSFERRGSASTVFLTPPAPPKQIDLEDDAGHVVGSVRPTLAPDNG